MQTPKARMYIRTCTKLQLKIHPYLNTQQKRRVNNSFNEEPVCIIKYSKCLKKRFRVFLARYSISVYKISTIHLPFLFSIKYKGDKLKRYFQLVVRNGQIERALYIQVIGTYIHRVYTYAYQTADATKWFQGRTKYTEKIKFLL